MEVTGYEARQTSKEQTKMPRFMLEGSRPCTIFCFVLIHYAWLRNQHVSVGQGQKKRTKTYNRKNSVGFHNHSPLLTTIFCRAFHQNLKNLYLVAATKGFIHQGCTIVLTQLYLLVVIFIHCLYITYKCVRSILGKDLKAIGHHFHGINCLDLGKVKT